MQLLDFSHTKLSTARSLLSYSKIQLSVAALIRNRRFLVRDVKDGEYLDVGSGPNIRGDYCDLDYSWRPGSDICWDVCRGLPIRDQCIGGVFTEHCIEHIPFEKFVFLAGEFHRVMKKGAWLRIVVPDGELYINNYVSRLPMPYGDSDALQGIYSPIMSLNRIMRSHGHQFIYDYETLATILKRQGFEKIAKQRFNEGSDPRLLIDTPERQIESLYVEAQKPA